MAESEVKDRTTGLVELRTYALKVEESKYSIGKSINNGFVPSGSEVSTAIVNREPAVRLLLQFGATHIVKRVVLNNTPFASHHALLGVPEPAKSQQHCATFKRGRHSYHGKIDAIGVTSNGDTIFHVQSFQVDRDLFHPLFSKLPMTEVGVKVRKMFNHVVIGNPYFNRVDLSKMFPSVFYSHELIGRAFIISVSGSHYFITLAWKSGG